jgi:tape measure domain-containing protein
VQQRARGLGDSLTKALGFLGIAGGFVGIQQAARSVVQLLDSFTALQNRLRTVTDGTAELTAATDALFVISQDTRSSFRATAELYTRVALASRELGISQRTTLEFTKSLNQAVILSGASAQEAEAGLIQLSQGIASGTLRGDELRSVLEQLPVVSDVIAESLGVTRGELRKMGFEGRITADTIITAFGEAADDLDRRFLETIPTISQGFQVLGNEAVKLVGSYNEATGASEAIGRARAWAPGDGRCSRPR